MLKKYDFLNFRDRFEYILEINKLNPTDLSKILGYNRSEKISRLIRENKLPTENILTDLIKHFSEINWGWVISGQGEPLLSENPGHHNTLVSHNRIKNIDINQSEYKQVSSNEFEIENKYLKQRIKELEETISDQKRTINKHIEEKERLLELLAKK